MALTSPSQFALPFDGLSQWTMGHRGWPGLAWGWLYRHEFLYPLTALTRSGRQVDSRLA